MLVVVLCDGIECAIPKSGNHRQKRVEVEVRMLMLKLSEVEEIERK